MVHAHACGEQLQEPDVSYKQFGGWAGLDDSTSLAVGNYAISSLMAVDSLG